LNENTKRFLQSLFAHYYIWTGGILTLIVVVSAIFAPYLTPFGPYDISVVNRLELPSSTHLFGTDNLGRDLLTRILYGGRISLSVGFFSVLFATAAGTIIGLVAVYYRRLDGLIMRILDGFMAFPDIILAITLAAIWGSGMWSITLAIGTAMTPRMARMVRSVALTVKEMDYVESARAVGTRDWKILLKYYLPNCISPIIVQATAAFAGAILAESALSFLGIGIVPPTPTWGGMINEGRQYLASIPTISLFPGLAIGIAVLGLNLLGDGFRDVLDPRLRDR
jgi:peptide/nickel transport system permease protein